MNRRAVIACFNLALVVGIGAFAAHLLAPELSAERLHSFETGLRYHFYHGLALLILAIIPAKTINIKGPWTMMLIGIVLFSFSIYGLSLRGLFGGDVMRVLGPVTPIGGALLISSWIWMGIKFMSRPH